MTTANTPSPYALDDWQQRDYSNQESEYITVRTFIVMKNLRTDPTGRL